MKPVFGTPQATGVGPVGGMATQTPTAKMFGYFGIALELVDEGKAARIGKPLDATHRRDAAEGGKHHGIAEGQLLLGFHRTIIGNLLDGHLAGLEFLDPRTCHPFDVMAAHLAFEQTLGVADAIEPQVADIGFRRNEGHRHAVADFAAAQFGLENEQELIGRTET